MNSSQYIQRTSKRSRSVKSSEKDVIEDLFDNNKTTTTTTNNNATDGNDLLLRRYNNKHFDGDNIVRGDDNE